ncbi:hypothetical protein AB3S75_026678 [Citrus x aurantiifolia]
MLNGGGGEISQRGSNIAHGITKYGGVHGSHNGKILSPLVVRSKGCPPYKRRQYKVEQIIQRKKQKKTTKGSQMISSETQRYGLEKNTTHAMVTSDNPMQHKEHFSLCNLLTVYSMNCNLALKTNADNWTICSPKHAS